MKFENANALDYIKSKPAEYFVDTTKSYARLGAGFNNNLEQGLISNQFQVKKCKQKLYLNDGHKEGANFTQISPNIYFQPCNSANKYLNEIYQYESFPERLQNEIKGLGQLNQSIASELLMSQCHQHKNVEREEILNRFYEYGNMLYRANMELISIENEYNETSEKCARKRFLNPESAYLIF